MQKIKTENKLALIIAYYLSRFDRSGYLNLGYKNFNEAVNSIGDILSVKATTVKNMRDEFDPYCDNHRKGWHQRKLSVSREKVIKSFEDSSEEDLRELVEEILHNSSFRESDVCNNILSIFVDKKDKYSKTSNTFSTRGVTGKKAEEIFIDYYNKHKKPIEGKLKDFREYGCGYDFAIIKGNEKFFIEVKGCLGDISGVLFTNKEWNKAKEEKEKYYLILVTNVDSEFDINIISDPANKLRADKGIIETIRVEWSVTKKEMQTIIRN